VTVFLSERNGTEISESDKRSLIDNAIIIRPPNRDDRKYGAFNDRGNEKLPGERVTVKYDNTDNRGAGVADPLPAPSNER